MRGYTAILPPEPVRFSTIRRLAEMLRQPLAQDAVAFILTVIFSWNNLVFGIVLAGLKHAPFPSRSTT
jgi:hypothetical protein